jgi:hypothetical protein
MLSWSYLLPHSNPSDLGGFFFARKPVAASFESYEIENIFSQLEGKRKIRSNLVLLGAIYGGNGYDFASPFR